MNKLNGAWKWVTTLLLFCIIQRFYGQEPAYIQYSIENGAPSNEIYSILQDKQGYIWIGSDAGVYRFNGVSYDYFSSPDLQARSATGLIQTPSGKIFGYNFRGQLFYVENQQLHVIKDWTNPVNGLAYDNDGNIWVSSQAGCFIVNDMNLSIRQHKSKLLNYDKNGHAFTSNIRRNASGKLFYQSGRKLIERDEKGFEKSFEIDECFEYTPLHISTSKKDPWLIGLTYPKSYFKKNGIFTPYLDDRLVNCLKDRKTNNVIEIDNDLWISTHTGVLRFNLISGNCEVFYPTIAFSGCLKDQEGNLWFSTLHHGLLKMPSVAIRAWNKRTSFGNLEQLSHIVSSPRHVYATSTNGELFLLDKKTLLPRLIHHDLQSDFAMLHFDSIDQQVYFNKFSYIFQLKGFTPHLINEQARSVKELAHTPKGYLILTSQGIYATQKLSNELTAENLIADGWYRDISQSPSGKDYFVAGNEGLFLLSYRNNQWAFSKKIFEGKQILSVSTDFHTGNTYFLTFDGEIYRISTTGMVHLEETNLSDYRATQLTVYKNALYLATIKGIVRINLSTKRKVILNTNTGLASNYVRQLVIQNDTCWAASGRGVMCIPLSEFNRPIHQGVLLEKKIHVNNQPVDRIPILQHDDLLTIYADGISYHSNGDFQLAYRIVGHTKGWIRVPGSLGKLEIPRLPSGDIRIELKMIDYLNLDSKNRLTYTLKVLPPYWQRWWFYLIFISLVGFSIYIFFLTRIKALRKKQYQTLKQLKLENELRLTQQNALKAQMNPHFLFNVLNSIKAYIYENDKKNAARYLSDFSSLVRNVLELSSKPTVSLEQELDALKLYIDLEAMLLQSDFTYHIIVDDNIDCASVKIPALLIQPYVENSFKHGLRHKTGKKELSILVNYGESEGILTICITDNGIGRQASGQINRQTVKEHDSFATQAMEKRIALLNHEKKGLVGVEIIDNFEEDGSPSGTTVNIRIHV